MYNYERKTKHRMKFTNYNIKHTTKRWLGIFLFFIFYFLLFASASAATLSIDPETKSVGPGDTFMATIRLDTLPDECVNAVSIELDYPPEWANASAVSKGESLLSLWPDEPAVDREHGKVTLSGGIPAGYCGRVQGDPGRTNIIAKIIFSIPGNMIGGKIATGPVNLPITFGSSTKVLLNDGFGSPAPLILHSGVYVRTLESQGLKNEWLDIVHADNTPPDLFTIAVEHDPHTFDGKYFIVFSAIDKQSGIQHYEVTEDDPRKLGFAYGKETHASFITATSPYVLTDQSLQSRIIVRAYDHAGNIQEAVHAPMHSTSTTGFSDTRTPWRMTSVRMIAGGILALLFIAIWELRARRKKEENIINEQ